jgi:hypothetical protein
MTAMDHSPSLLPNLPAQTAMRAAWACWLVLLVLPFLFFIYVLWTLMGAEENVGASSIHSGQGWFLTSMIYLIVAVPLSFFGRSWLFKAYWTGKPVEPRKYLLGMLTMWLTLEIGGLFALAGCLVDHKILPNLLPALVAFMFFTTLWPSGRAMTRTTGHLEDPQLYEEPR